MNKFNGKHGPLLIAEIGGNHEGDFSYAQKLTELAISTGCDAVKYQLYSGDTLVNKKLDPDRNLHFKKFELTKSQHIELAKQVVNSGLKYMASVWNKDYLEWVDDYIEIYKIGSGDLTAYPILNLFAQRNKPIILSTGLSFIDEVIDAVSFIQSVNSEYKNKEKLALLQCTSMYPITNADANLSVITSLKQQTGLTIGYSDHTIGYKALLYAYILGAEILEFHFTDSREGKKFRDHKVSLTPDEVAKLIEEIKIINDLLGNKIKKPTLIEIENNHLISFRRGVFTTRFIKKGEVIKEQDLIALRPAIGIGAQFFYTIIGKKANRDIRPMEKLEFSYFS